MQGKQFAQFLPGTLPGPVNSLLHKGPFASLVTKALWSLLLLFGTPVAYSAWAILLGFQLFGQFIWKPRRILPLELDDEELAVIVTGCDSGFGKELVLRLASEGFHVFAGILQESSAKSFQGEPLIHSLPLDVTKDEDVRQAVESVERWIIDDTGTKKKRYLHAVVTNAGIGKFGLIDWTKLDDYELCMQVNCFGPIRMVKSFLPLLKKQAVDGTYGDSQIVNIISCAGMLSAGGLGGTPYEVSKHAADAFTDSLRLEMQTFGIKVVAVNPSFHATDVVHKADNEYIWNNLSAAHQAEYGKDFVTKFTTYARKMTKIYGRSFKVVVDALVNIIQSTAPPAQSVLGMDFRFGMLGLRMVPQWLRHQWTLLFLPNLTPAVVLAAQKKKSKDT